MDKHFHVCVCVCMLTNVCVCVCVCSAHALCLFVCSLNGGAGRFVRGKLVYWSLNRVNEETSQPEGEEKVKCITRDERQKEEKEGKIR